MIILEEIIIGIFEEIINYDIWRENWDKTINKSGEIIILMCINYDTQRE